MTECLICEDDFRVDETNEHRIIAVRTDMMDKGDRFGVCPSCRTHAAIGRAVEKMREGNALFRWHGLEWGLRKSYPDMPVRYPTPLDALRAAGLTDEEKK